MLQSHPMLGKEAQEADGTWAEFTGSKQRKIDEFVSLVQSPEISPEFQHRALINLFSEWNVIQHRGVLRGVIGKLSPEQAQYSNLLLTKTTDELQQSTDGRSKAALGAYFDVVLGLLRKLPPDDEKEWIQRIIPNHPWPTVLVFDYRLSSEGRRLAADRVHKIIDEERSGRKVAIHTKDARMYPTLTRYIGELVINSDDAPEYKKLAIGKELEYVLEVTVGPINAGRHGFGLSREIGSILPLLRTRATAKDFLDRELLFEGDDSEIQTKNDADLARQIISEFPDDKKLRTNLERMLKVWEKHEAGLEELRRKRHDELIEEQRIIGKMKIKPTR